MYITEQFAEFIANTNYEDLPEAVIAQAKERVMDTLGAAIAGSINWEYCENLKTACKAMGTGKRRVIGDSEAVYPAARVAMINATYAHAIELDDGHKNAGCHAGATIVPTAFAMAQEMGKSGKELLAAVAIGYEVTYRIASHVNPKQINKGFHPSSNCGAYGAMAVAGKLMGLTAEQIANGLGQAGMFASGTMEATKSGQRAKCVQVGHAAFNGVLAAYIAQTGMEGCISALEGPNGLFATQSEDVDVEDVCKDLGTVYHIADTYNKMYPSCRHAQPGIEAVLDIASEEGLKPEEVESIWIGTHKVAYELTGIIKAPANSGQAKFSLAYGSAVALYEHAFGVAHLTEKFYTDSKYLELAEKVTCEISDEVQAVYPKRRGAKVIIRTTDGRSFEKELYDLKGSPDNPVGWKELAAKFSSSAIAVLSAEDVEKMLELLAHLDEQDNVDVIMNML